MYKITVEPAILVIETKTITHYYVVVEDEEGRRWGTEDRATRKEAEIDILGIRCSALQQDFDPDRNYYLCPMDPAPGSLAEQAERFFTLTAC